MKLLRALTGSLLGLALLAGCTDATAPPAASPAAPGGVTSPAGAPPHDTDADDTDHRRPDPHGDRRSPTTPAPTTPTTPTKQAPNPVSIQALIDRDYVGRALTLGREGGSTSAYRQYYATYEGNGLTISGRINIPRGKGPFPAVVLAHGYVDPDEYTNGQTMLRERDYLARQGYVTLHIDYRNHAQSDDDPGNAARLRLGYTEDAITAALALQQDDRVDPDRIALIGRSMGGGVVYNALVVRPGLFRAGVAYSPVSSDAVDNFNRWVRDDDDRSGTAAAVIARLGTPEARPAAWAAASPRGYFGRITEPVLIHHGTADEECPIAWTTETVAALEAAGKDVTSYTYRGQRHTFTSQWPLSIRRTATFLERGDGLSPSRDGFQLSVPAVHVVDVGPAGDRRRGATAGEHRHLRHDLVEEAEAAPQRAVVGVVARVGGEGGPPVGDVPPARSGERAAVLLEGETGAQRGEGEPLLERPLRQGADEQGGAEDVSGSGGVDLVDPQRGHPRLLTRAGVDADRAVGPVGDDGDGDAVGEGVDGLDRRPLAGVAHRLDGVGHEDVAPSEAVEHRVGPRLVGVPADVGEDEGAVGPGAVDPGRACCAEGVVVAEVGDDGPGRGGHPDELVGADRAPGDRARPCSGRGRPTSRR